MATRKRKPRTGRPRTSMTRERIKALLEVIEREGLRVDTAARIVGLATSTVRDHRRRHKDFDEQILVAEARAEAEAIREVRRGGKDWTARAWFAERRWPQSWSRPELLLQQNVHVSTEGVVAGISEMLQTLATKWNPPGAVDTDVDGPDASAAAEQGDVATARDLGRVRIISRELAQNAGALLLSRQAADAAGETIIVGEPLDNTQRTR